MIVPPFDASRFFEYGDARRKDVETMAACLEAYDLPIDYNSREKRFTIYDTGRKSAGLIQRILASGQYSLWRPKVLEERDVFGNKKVELVSIVKT
jgi:hypothetical protein